MGLARCKTHAAGCEGAGPPGAVAGWADAMAAAPRACAIAVQPRASLTQGKPAVLAGRWTGALWLLLGALPVAQAADCPGPALRFDALAADVWLVPAAAGDSDAGNRGQVSNLVLVRARAAPQAEAGPAEQAAAGDVGLRWWLLGSGPSPAVGRALACQLQQRLGAVVSDVISPWARPELVLGVAGLTGGREGVGVVTGVGVGAPAGPGTAAVAVRHWAHAAVADAMAEQCSHCVDRLRQRLGVAADDLGPDPIRLPDHRLQGEQGALGPFRWWRLPRAEGRWVTVWRLRATPLWLAPGLLDGNGPPDGRDADLAMLRDASRQLARWAAADGPAAVFVGEQGPVMDSGAPARHAAYWDALLAAATAAVNRGDDETAPAPGWPGLPARWAAAAWHGLNWQRAWRQVEPQVLAAPPR
jgi:hypothetical protein